MKSYGERRSLVLGLWSWVFGFWFLAVGFGL